MKETCSTDRERKGVRLWVEEAESSERKAVRNKARRRIERETENLNRWARAFVGNIY